MAEAANDPVYRAALERFLPCERSACLVIRVRMGLGISQGGLARRVGTSPAAIARLEGGHHRPSVETLHRVARALDRDLVIGFQPPRGAGEVDGAAATGESLDLAAV
jgi:transcriptional regulator with XRE-family HTH domain